MKSPAADERAQAVPTTVEPDEVRATAVMPSTGQRGETAASPATVVRRSQEVRPGPASTTEGVGRARTAATSPSAPVASPSGRRARVPGRFPGVQAEVPAARWASTENVRSAEGRKPAVSDPVVAAPTTRPPLSATPGGVASTHDGEPALRSKSS